MQSSPVVKNAANWLFPGEASRLETTAVDDLMHPKCTLVGPPGFAARSLTAKDSLGAASGARARSLWPGPTAWLSKAVLHDSSAA